MAEWFETKVKFLRQMDNGLIKQITEQYLVDSMSFTEAEGRVMTEATEGMREVTVVSIKRSAIKETVMYGDTDMFFKVKVSYTALDEVTEKEKKINTYLLVNANDAKSAYERTEEHLKEMLVPFSIVSIAESPIIEVYQYQKGLRPGLRKVVATDGGNGATIGGDGTILRVGGEFEMGEKEQSSKVPKPKRYELDEVSITKSGFQVGYSERPDPTDEEKPDYPVWLLDQLAGIIGGNKTVGQLSNIVNQHDLREPFDFEVWLQHEHSPTERQTKDCMTALKQPRE